MRMRWAAGLVLMGAMMAAAQTPASQKRADGAVTPLMEYGSAMNGGVCAPLALISHGAGGSERGYAYLAEGLAARGWFAVVMGHKESGRLVAEADVAAKGSRQDGLQELVATPSAYTARLMDVGAGLAWAKTQCTAARGIPFRALLGHSMGAETVMLEAGAASKLGLPPGQDRFDAYVAMSVAGPGTVWTEDSWSRIRKPMFVLTGTLDGYVNGGAKQRQVAYTDLPPDGERGCHWLGVIDGATHRSFGGRGPNPAVVNAEIVSTVDSFLKGARAGKCVLPAKVAGFRMESK